MPAIAASTLPKEALFKKLQVFWQPQGVDIIFSVYF